MTSDTASHKHSTPVYAEAPSPVPCQQRIMLAQDASHAEVARFVEAMQALQQPVTLVGLTGRAPQAVHQEIVPDRASLGQRLTALLNDAPLCTRLHVCGDEAFLWHCHALAQAAGLADEQIELIRLGQRRHLYCVHCSCLQEIAEEGEATCQGCGVRLLVREHFSRRLGAYMGVCLDACDPRGEGRP
ncbi:dimethylamine monooxygenase subunit DmmA family protein [Pseudomonas sp. NPDC047963]|nr:hypothetical protein [Pseudomonas sp.]